MTVTTTRKDLLAADTNMGAVTLRAGNLDTLIAYYRDAVTLDLISHIGPVAVLGRGTTPIVILQHAPELAAAEPRSAGLFHTAILFETQTELAKAVYSVGTKHPGTFTGSADHLVSQAFYFTDPEGNGIELYWDRDRTLWSWTHGQVEMATLALDPNAFIGEHLTEASAADPTHGPAVVGHIHLSVGDVASAREFYVNRLGFEATANFGPSALFVSAGGYHHHMAMNTWQSQGAGRRRLALGLGEVSIVVPGTGDIGALSERMSHYGVETRHDGQTLGFDDPWANRILVRAAH
ncbi:VOC family protein [Cryobacterium melibiosiphilum]|uniref:VOC family protein n=1 Tax=Cryobacterium melibiosiphilum TaxID=995039 RepID=A0A3A5MJJ4_9MICO|nr:VOC family protein [Cryobacterium melibiosiphilum]RJT89071.1 VOC family protein [Cryobacterium melibiosiphilum]